MYIRTQFGNGTADWIVFIFKSVNQGIQHHLNQVVMMGLKWLRRIVFAVVTSFGVTLKYLRNTRIKGKSQFVWEINNNNLMIPYRFVLG